MLKQRASLMFYDNEPNIDFFSINYVSHRLHQSFYQNSICYMLLFQKIIKISTMLIVKELNLKSTKTDKIHDIGFEYYYFPFTHSTNDRNILLKTVQIRSSIFWECDTSIIVESRKMPTNLTPRIHVPCITSSFNLKLDYLKYHSPYNTFHNLIIDEISICASSCSERIKNIERPLFSINLTKDVFESDNMYDDIKSLYNNEISNGVDNFLKFTKKYR